MSRELAAWAKRARAIGALASDRSDGPKQLTEFTCGPAVLAQALGKIGIATTEADLTKPAGTNMRGTLPGGLVEAAEKLGARARLVEDIWIDEILEMLDRGAQPILMIMGPKGRPHFVLATATGKLGDGLIVEDPATGEEREMSLDELGRLWDVDGHRGVAVIVEPVAR